MNTLEFLQRVVPEGQVHVVTVIDPTKDTKPHQHAVGYLEQFAEEILRRDALEAGKPNPGSVFHACSSYVDGTLGFGLRFANNVAAVKSYWLDLDVGADNPKKYPTQQAAVEDLVRFCTDADLPIPIMVNSGYGLHAYWPLSESILRDRWHRQAVRLKAVTEKLKLKVDPARTADAASVLRTPGTYNRKKPTTPMLVEVINEDPVLDIFPGDFERALDNICAKLKINPKDRPKKLNEGADVISVSNADANLIALKCNQLRLMKDSKGASQDEPTWYATLGVLKHCRDGDTIAHEWGSGHQSYTVDGTDAKMEQAREAFEGATRCEKFQSVNASGCEGCPFIGQINSPISLGLVIAEATAATIQYGDEIVELPQPPKPWKRGDEDTPGIWKMPTEEEEAAGGTPVQIYPYDLYPYQISKDTREEREYIHLHHGVKPEHGPEDIRVRSDVLHSPKDAMAAFINQQVHVEPWAVNLFMAFVHSYLRRVRDEAKLRELHHSAGWRPDGSFVFGKKLITKNGPQPCGLAPQAASVLTRIQSAGDRDAWIERTKYLNLPGMEQSAFIFMLMAGSPLSGLSSSGGICVNIYSSETGLGKSQAAQWGTTIYGDWDAKNIGHYSPKSTNNALPEFLGVNNNLPVCIDEITDKNIELLSEQLYEVAGGVGKTKLRRDSTIRPPAVWSNYLIMSANNRILDKLAAAGLATEARGARMIEYEFEVHPENQWIRDEMYKFLPRNYGLVGEEYIQTLVNLGPEELLRQVNLIRDALAGQFGRDPVERFWLSTMSESYVACKIGREAGLWHVDEDNMIDWMNGLRLKLRGDVEENRDSAQEALVDFINQHSNSIVIANSFHKTASFPVSAPDQARSDKILMRVDKHENVMYINQKAIMAWLGERHINVDSAKRELKDKKILEWTTQKWRMGTDLKNLAGMAPEWLVCYTWKVRLGPMGVDIAEPGV